MTDTHAPTTFDPSAVAWQIFLQRPTFMAILNPLGVVCEVNRAIEARGFAREAFMGRHIADTPYFAADSTWRATWDARLAEVRAAGRPVGYDDAIVSADGHVRYAEATVTPISAGHVADWFLVEAEDTTERLQVELALREGERRSHDLLSALPAVAWSIDASGDCDFVNQRWLDELGRIPSRGGRRDWSAVVDDLDRDAFASDWGLARAAGVPLTGRYRLRVVGRGARWYEVRIAPVLGDDGLVARWSGLAVELGAVDAPRR